MSRFQKKPLPRNSRPILYAVTASLLCVSVLAQQSAKSDFVDLLLAEIKKSPSDAAARSLISLKDPRSVDPLIADLKDDSPKVRRLAAMVLGEMKATRVADPLIDARVNQDLVARAVDPLIDSLADQDRVVRADAAKALGQIGDKRAIPPLLATLNDPNPAVECASAIALGTLRSSDAVNPLLALLKTQTNWVVGSCVVPALGDIGNSHPADDHISGSATYALGELRDPRAILPLARILKDAKRSYEAAAVALGKIGGPAIKVLAEALKDGEPKVRESAVLGLGVTESPEAIKPLVKALKDSNQDVRVSALTAIRRINPPDMKKIMIAAQKNPNQDVREGATQWLATKHNP